MVCNLCGVNEASIHLTEIVNNQMIEIHICESCAQEKGSDFKTHFNFGDLLAGITQIDKSQAPGDSIAVIQCEECGMTYDEFTKNGRLGCPECYRGLNKMLKPLIKRVQRATEHVGKNPKKLGIPLRKMQDLRKLQGRLRDAIQSEEFEEAAKLRDQIRKVQEASEKGGNERS